MSTSFRFFLLLAICLPIQAYLWQHTSILDGRQWSKMVVSVAHWNEGIHNEFTGGYPNTPLLLVSAFTYGIFGIPAKAALAGSLAVFVSTIAATIGVVCYRLRPKSPWWIAVPCMIALNSLLPSGTPPTILVAVSLVLLTLYALLLIEQKTPITIPQTLIFGALAGFAVTHRFDFALVFSVPIFVLLLYVKSWKQIIWALPTGIAVFILLDPFLWFFPLEHIYSMWHKLWYHAAEYNQGQQLKFHIILQYVMFALFGFSFSVLSLFMKQIQIINRYFISVLLGITVITLIALLFSRYQALWYLLPFVLTWEAFAPLFILDLVAQSSPPARINRMTFLRASHATITTIFVVGFAALFINHVTLPEVTIFLPW